MVGICFSNRLQEFLIIWCAIKSYKVVSNREMVGAVQCQSLMQIRRAPFVFDDSVEKQVSLVGVLPSLSITLFGIDSGGEMYPLPLTGYIRRRGCGKSKRLRLQEQRVQGEEERSLYLLSIRIPGLFSRDHR